MTKGLLVIIVLLLFGIGTYLHLIRQNIKGQFVYNMQLSSLAMSNKIDLKTIDYIMNGVGEKPDDKELSWAIYSLLVNCSTLYKQKRYGNFDKNEWNIVTDSIERLFESQAVRQEWLGYMHHSLWDEEFREFGTTLFHKKNRETK